jgi:fatty-acyl-CoA synthase
MSPSEFLPFLVEAAEGLRLSRIGAADVFDRLPQSQETLCPLEPTELAYLQYTSGSTRFPRGVMITQAAALANLEGITKHGLKIRSGDRAVSWLPFYHDMGLVGFVLGPMVSQVSVDYLKTRAFAMRPRLWLSLMTQVKATISFGPSFGYEMCVRRLRQDEIGKFDLSAWRVAGVGAETIRADALEEFADVLAPSGFKPSAFLACYGMAECCLAVSFAPLDEGIAIDQVDRAHLSDGRGVVCQCTQWSFDIGDTNRFVDCGVPLPAQVEVRDRRCVLPGRHAGVIFLRGLNVMSGYWRS